MRGAIRLLIAAWVLEIPAAAPSAGPSAESKRDATGALAEAPLVQTDPGGPGQRYSGQWFSLWTTTDEHSAGRIAACLEQAFLAYQRVLPARLKPDRALKISVYGSFDEYRTHLQRLKLPIENPAVFVERENLVLCGSDAARYTAQLAQIAETHDRLRSELARIKERLPARLVEFGHQLQLQGKARGEIAALMAREKRSAEQEIKLKQVQIARCERDNERLFDKVAGATLRRLYHEGFHAYSANYVYPAPKYRVPLWLNEGLASAFEMGAVDGTASGFTAVRRSALERLKAELKSGRALPLSRLLASSPQDYLSAIDRTVADSDRYYDYAWGLAYYLTFERKLLGSPEMERYLLAGEDGSPRERFQLLVGHSLEGFEKQWHQWLMRPPSDS